MNNNFAAIMAGGIGSRFWPASRTGKPKQFLDILGTGQTLLQSTFERFSAICPPENIFILTNADYVNIVKEQLPGINESQILAEPVRKNTAPCIAYAAYKIRGIHPDANIIVAPSDHIILNQAEFKRIADLALDFVSTNNALCTLGIVPGRPDTGYGYIQFYEEEVQSGIHKVKTFTEKPDRKTAERFVSSGEFLWNAGIFIWNVNHAIQAFQKYLPEVGEAFEEAETWISTEMETAAIEKAFALCPNISIDFGIMEKADNVYVLPSDFGWSDLGTWASLYEEKEKDYLQNAVTGNNVVIYDSSNNIIHVPDHKMVVLQGLENYIVVDTPDVLLVCSKDQEQRIKEFTQDIKINKGDRFL
jgi:mannose-1-phosphate guanylyltransferase